METTEKPCCEIHLSVVSFPAAEATLELALFATEPFGNEGMNGCWDGQGILERAAVVICS
jgi:hypothetical protein